MAKFFLFIIAALLIVVSLGQVSGHAQINPFGRYSLELKKEDINAMNKVTKPFFGDPNAQPGKEVTWKNEKTGSNGRVKLLETFQKDGRPCKKVEHVMTLGSTKKSYRYVLNRCRAEDGTWKLIP